MNLKTTPEFNCSCLSQPATFQDKGADLAAIDAATVMAHSIRGLGDESPWCGAGAVVIGARALGRYIHIATSQVQGMLDDGYSVDGSVKGPLTEAQWAEIIEHVRAGYDHALAQSKK